MTKKAGIWIDHRRAVLVTLDGENESIEEIESDAERHARPTKGAPAGTPYGAQDASAEAKSERHFEHQLKDFYGQVVAAAGDIDSILLTGPGEAKTELRKEIEKAGLAGKISDVQAADKMTDRQFAAKVREYFTS